MIQRLYDLQKKKRNQEDGFTLIELLIVIIVLGILAAIVVFAVGSTRKDSVAASCKTNFKAVELSAEAVNTKQGSYPAVPGDLLNSAGKGGLLKALPAPTSTDYSLVYEGVGAAAPFSDYKISVMKGDGTTVAGTTSAGCSNL